MKSWKATLTTLGAMHRTIIIEAETHEAAEKVAAKHVNHDTTFLVRQRPLSARELEDLRSWKS